MHLVWSVCRPLGQRHQGSVQRSVDRQWCQFCGEFRFKLHSFPRLGFVLSAANTDFISFFSSPSTGDDTYIHNYWLSGRLWHVWPLAPSRHHLRLLGRPVLQYEPYEYVSSLLDNILA